MAKEIALGLLIGGAVSSTLGRAINTSKDQIEGLQKKAQQAKLWQNVIGETQRLQGEFRTLHMAGDKAADGIRKKIDGNLATLRKAGIEVDKLDKHYQKLGRTARGLELRAAGHERIGTGIEQAKDAAGGIAKVGLGIAAPTMIAADYQAIVRDIAIKGGIARTAEEGRVSRTVIDTADRSGMARNQVAETINQLVGGGMDLGKALAYSSDAAKFAVGQGASGTDTAKMIGALEQNARITDPAAMRQALNSIAYLGKAGSFESNDMARWFPEMLAEMQKLGIVGQESVSSLGSMLQVQMKTAGGADQAANNLKNWMSKIGSDETRKRYGDAGIDYEAQMRQAIGQGWNTLEASFLLARGYVEKIDPEKAKQLAEAAKQISQQADPAKQKAMMAAFAETMKTGDVFADMQVKSALTAYMQGADLYGKLKAESKQATKDIEKDLADRRAASKQTWAEAGQAWDDAMRAIGDGMRPATDAIGSFASTLGSGVKSLAEAAPMAVSALAAVAAGFVAFKGAQSTWNMGRGALDLARGTVLAGRGGRGKLGKLGNMADAVLGGGPGIGVQQVFVTNWPGGGLPDGLGGGSGKGAKGKPGLMGRAWNGIKGAGGWAAGAAGGLAATGRVALMAPTLGSIGGLGAAGVGTSAGMVAGSGVAGYGAGMLLNKGMGALSGWSSQGKHGGDGWLGSRLFDAFNGAEQRKLSSRITLDEINAIRAQSGRAPVTSLPGATQGQAPAVSQAVARAGPAVPQQMTFAPVLQLTVNGDVKDPRQIANEIFPHLRGLFTDYQAKQASGALFDSMTY